MRSYGLRARWGHGLGRACVHRQEVFGLIDGLMEDTMHTEGGPSAEVPTDRPWPHSKQIQAH